MSQITVIASAFKQENDLVANFARHKEMKDATDQITGVHVEEVVGSYGHVQELALRFTIPEDREVIRQVEHLFFDVYGQESILYIHGEKQKVASLRYRHGGTLALGELKRVSRDAALYYGNFVHMDGFYYRAATVDNDEEVPKWGQRQVKCEKPQPFRMHEYHNEK